MSSINIDKMYQLESSVSKLANWVDDMFYSLKTCGFTDVDSIVTFHQRKVKKLIKTSNNLLCLVEDSLESKTINDLKSWSTEKNTANQKTAALIDFVNILHNLQLELSALSYKLDYYM